MNTFCLAIIVVPILAVVLICGALVLLERKGILYPSDTAVQRSELENRETNK